MHTVEIDGEAVLLDQAAERLHHLNATATLVWACLDGRASLGHDRRRCQLRSWASPYDTVLADTVAVIRQLGDEGLLDGVDPDPAADRDLV